MTIITKFNINDKITTKVVLDMSKQENVELEYATMAELYASKHNISCEEALNIFSKYLVYENIVSQSDFWGHYNYDENLEYIENTLLNDDKKQMLVYHGSIYDFNLIDLDKSNGYRDFGNGFYTTVLYSQSQDWALRNKRRSLNKKAYVYTFMYDYWKNGNLKVKEFTSCTNEWLDFVIKNRKSKILIHDYDIVLGPVADDNVNETLDLFQSGVINKESALERLSFTKTSNQISFHTKKAVECLTLIEKEIK